MISVTAAALLAQVLPVGLLAIAIEAAVLRPRGEDHLLFKAVRFVVFVISFVAIWIGVLAVTFCVLAVINDKPIDDAGSVAVVATGSVAIALSMSFLLPAALFQRIFARKD